MLMDLLHSGLYAAADGVTLCLALFLLYKGLWKRLLGVWVYLIALLVIDGVARRYVLYHFGFKSIEYFYFYWFTDTAFALGAFLLISAFFRRACASQDGKVWHHVRLLLVLVFVLVLGISTFALTRNYDHLFSMFMFEFQQNLYFTCLVLNTLLYIMMQRMYSEDGELGLLVCGMGLQFAGPAASFALKSLTPKSGFTEMVMDFVVPLCTLGMLLVWSYAVTRKPVTARVPESGEMVHAGATG
jgi:hypothetical protein